MISPSVTAVEIVIYLLFISHLTHQAITSSHPHCWGHADAGPTLTYRDCLNVINQQVIRGRDLDIPVKFSRDPTINPDVILPISWASRTGDCFVGLDFAPGGGGYDRTSWRDIQRAAQAIGVLCVIKEPHRGGIIQIGWYDNLALVLLAPPPALNDKNRTLAIA